MIKEDDYESEVSEAAATLASEFSVVCPRLKSLDFDAEISSKIFTVRPKMSRGQHTLLIPTTFLCRTFGLAMSHQVAAQQHTFFRMLSSHPSFCDAGGVMDRIDCLDEDRSSRSRNSSRVSVVSRGHAKDLYTPYVRRPSLEREPKGKAPALQLEPPEYEEAETAQNQQKPLSPLVNQYEQCRDSVDDKRCPRRTSRVRCPNCVGMQ